MINYTELSKQLETKTARMSKSEQFSYALTLLWRTSYGYGRENITRSDCSGLLSAAFYLTGIDIRVTADTFYYDVFTEHNNYVKQDYAIGAYFVHDLKLSRVTHVAPVIENGICLDTKLYAELTTFNMFFSQYNRNDCLVLPRFCDWNNALAYSKVKPCVYGLDPELKRLRKV